MTCVCSVCHPVLVLLMVLLLLLLTGGPVVEEGNFQWGHKTVLALAGKWSFPKSSTSSISTLLKQRKKERNRLQFFFFFWKGKVMEEHKWALGTGRCVPQEHHSQKCISFCLFTIYLCFVSFFVNYNSPGHTQTNKASISDSALW